MKMIKVESSNIESIGVEEVENIKVRFKGGAEYVYTAPKGLFAQFNAAESKGKFLAQYIKGKLPFKKVEKVK